ncbi:MAG: hypothetical protein ACKVHE_06615 [Planctomycetales bacterium]|jgi:hypothetical protein
MKQAADLRDQSPVFVFQLIEYGRQKGERLLDDPSFAVAHDAVQAA